jgi:hypothetical protein
MKDKIKNMFEKNNPVEIQKSDYELVLEDEKDTLISDINRLKEQLKEHDKVKYEALSIYKTQREELDKLKTAIITRGTTISQLKKMIRR